MRIGAVAQHHSLQWVTLGRRRVLFSKVATDCLIVLGGHLERLERETVPQRLAYVAALPSIQKCIVIRRIGQDTHPFVILGCRPEKSDTPDVDLLDGVRERTPGFRDGGGKWIEVTGDDGDLGDGLLCEVALVRRDRTRKDALTKVYLSYRADSGRERLPPWTAGWSVLTRPPSISGALVMLETSLGDTFRTYMEAMGVEDVLDVDIRLPDLFRGASRTEESDACCTEAFRELDQTGFIVDGQQC